METKEFTPKQPDYVGSGVSVWKATDKNNKTYLKVCVLGGKAINCFKNEPKVKRIKPEDI